MVRACPFLVTGICSVRFSTETSHQRAFRISPRRMAVSSANCTRERMPDCGTRAQADKRRSCSPGAAGAPLGLQPWAGSRRQSIVCERHIPVTPSHRKRMAQDVQLAVHRAWLHALETLGAVRAHHACGDITERHVGQWVPQERIEGECLAVGPAFARHHFVPIAADDVGHRDAPKCPVNLWSTLVGLKLLLTCPYERVGLRAERTRDARSAFAPHLNVPSLSSPPQCRQSATSLCQNCASEAFFVFLRRFGKFTKPLSGLVNLMVGVAGFEPATPTSRTWCATRLRYTPTDGRSYNPGILKGKLETDNDCRARNTRFIGRRQGDRGRGALPFRRRAGRVPDRNRLRAGRRRR